MADWANLTMVGAPGRAPSVCDAVALPRLRLDPAVWERTGGAEADSPLIAHIVLGDTALRLEAWARCEADDARGTGPTQAAEIDGRRYLVVAYQA